MSSASVSFRACSPRSFWHVGTFCGAEYSGETPDPTKSTGSKGSSVHSGEDRRCFFHDRPAEVAFEELLLRLVEGGVAWGLDPQGGQQRHAMAAPSAVGLPVVLLDHQHEQYQRRRVLVLASRLAGGVEESELNLASLLGQPAAEDDLLLPCGNVVAPSALRALVIRVAVDVRPLVVGVSARNVTIMPNLANVSAGHRIMTPRPASEVPIR